MSVRKLPNWVLTNKYPAFYDSESATAIEQTAKVYGAMNELIADYNTFITNLEARIEEFETTTNADIEAFKIGIRQEFQDFIDIVDLRIEEQNLRITNAEKYMNENIVSTTEKVVNEAIKNGAINVYETYDESTESLNLNVNGGA